MAKDIEYTADDIQVLSDREHVRLRTQVYVGSTHPTTFTIPLLSEPSLVIEDVTFIPAVYKLIGEIIDNSIDEFSQITSKSKTLKITANTTIGKYTISDTGRGIPIEKKTEISNGIETEIWTPELALARLRAGRNFSNNREVGVQGMNGVGSACTNFCSSEFNVNIHRNNLLYNQQFTDGAKNIFPPTITQQKTRVSGTEISFVLDNTVFSDISLPNSLIRNRAIEIALTNPDITVVYNSERFKFNNGLQEYINKIAANKISYKFMINEENIQGEIYVICDGHSGLDEQIYTWVNSSFMFDGGKCNVQFFNVLCDRVIMHLDREAKKLKTEVTRNDVRNGLLILANIKIKNPEYDSQSKTRLTGPDLRKDFITTIDANWKTFAKTASSWLTSVLERANERHHRDENKKAIDDHEKRQKRKIKVAGLLDATSSNRSDCQLLLTEGLCIEENTNIITVNDNGVFDSPIKLIKEGDFVITHEGKLRPVTNVVKTVKSGVKIVLKNEVMITSSKHKLLVYNKNTTKFDWIRVDEINKEDHQLVRSKLKDFMGIVPFEIKKNEDDEDKDIYPYVVSLGSDYLTYKTSVDHTFVVYDTQYGQILELPVKELNSDIHQMVIVSKEGRNVVQS